MRWRLHDDEGDDDNGNGDEDAFDCIRLNTRSTSPFGWLIKLGRRCVEGH